MFAGADFDFYLPLQDGDDIYCVNYLAEAREKQGKFAGRQLLEFREEVFRNQRRDVVARW